MSPVASKRTRTVSFDSVHIHEHVVILGDNPSVSSGLPVALGGRFSTDIMDIEEYEQYERRGRKGGARILTKQDRANLIRGTQTFLSILKAKRELKRIQKSRQVVFQEQIKSKENIRPAVKIIWGKQQQVFP